MKKFTKFSLDFLFKISNQPVLFRDLLEANALFNENMLVDPAKLNFRLKTFNAYVYFGCLCVLILLPLLAITHYFLAKLDSHISILSAVFVTAAVFIGFDIFKIYTRKIISKKQIKTAWAQHLPYFAYEKYSQVVAEIYKDALKSEISRTNLEQFILEKIMAHSK